MSKTRINKKETNQKLITKLKMKLNHQNNINREKYIKKNKNTNK